jgi:hypothetical protein
MRPIRENIVNTITIKLRRPDLSREMAEMRTWLDHHGYEPSRFHCDQHGDEVVTSVAFRIDAQADAFAARFQAQSSRSAPDGEGLVPNPAA